MMSVSGPRLCPSPSMVVAFVALVVALGGTSYAVTRLPAGSVGSKQLKRGAVARAHIKNGAVNGSKVANDSLTGADVVEGSLGQVPSAVSAAGAAHANATAVLDKVAYRTAGTAVPPSPDMGVTPGVASATAVCDAGQLVVGGGVKVDDAVFTSVVDSFPDAGGRAWTARVDNSDATAHNFAVYAACVPAGAVG